MGKRWNFELNDQNHTLIVESDFWERRLFYFDGCLLYKESFMKSYKKRWKQQWEGEIEIYSFKDKDGNEFSIREEGRWTPKIKLYINGENADLKTSFYHPRYIQNKSRYIPEKHNNEPKISNKNDIFKDIGVPFFKDILIPFFTLLIGGGGIIGLIKGFQELTRPTTTTNSQQATERPKGNTSGCSLQSGAYKAIVTRDKGLGLRAKPLDNETIIKRIKINQEIIVLRKNQDGNWLYVCLNGTTTRGWIIGEHTKKIQQ
ncbi:hypothetical protein [Nostoc sp. UHCC 0870]|uniref:hypothetical protein n=1 Tax=Nostoc sp. UHCC 0870 TaxID=2914041 RepID=UPI001EE14863|nr:hypothetical protein [Nostoc sp. UHCC 0870]UKO96960.1 hypothetical protein L6494_20520 [Nostoc sp. UHCC 0870]